MRCSGVCRWKLRAAWLAGLWLCGCSQIIDAGDATFAPAGSGRLRIGVDLSRKGDLFGLALNLTGDELVVGAPGADLTHVRSNNSATCGTTVDVTDAGRVWRFDLTAAVPAAPIQALMRERADDGETVSLYQIALQQPFMALARAGDLLAVGIPGMDYTACATGVDVDAPVVKAGGVYLFARDADGNFRQVSYVPAQRPVVNGGFGLAVAMRSDRLFVGAPGEPSVAQDGAVLDKGGVVYVFALDGSQWTLLSRLDPDHSAANAGFGDALAVDGDTLAVGAWLDSPIQHGSVAGGSGGPTTINTGTVYVFRERDGTDWTQEAFITPDDPQAVAAFGLSLALEGDTLVVGAPNEAVGGEMRGAGAAHVYRRGAGHWMTLAHLMAPEPETGAGFGLALAMRAGRLLVGAAFQGPGFPDGANAGDDTGAAYLYDSVEPGAQPRELPISTRERASRFGTAVALGTRWAVVAGPAADEASGEVRVFDLTP